MATIPKDVDFLDHIEELRWQIFRIIFAFIGVFIVCFVDQDFYMRLALYPHQTAMKTLHLPVTIQVLKYEETFFCYLQISFISALIWTTPFALYQIWRFCEEALEDVEKQYFLLFLPASLLFFILGVIFGYFVLIPLGLQFLAGYGSEIVQVGFTLSSYLSLFFILTFVAGITFELPLVMLFLFYIGWMTTKDYIEKWRYFILAAFFLAAILTPPDAVTQILLAIPMVGLYFLGILICQISEKFHLLQKLFRASKS